MKNKYKKKIKYLFLIIPLIVLNLFICCFGLFNHNYANAVTVTGYTGVLSDLKIDDNFSEDNFPVNADDTSLELIQIAESTGGELFIYTYQPSAKERQFVLTTISISQTLYNNAKWELYDLKLIDSDGVFAKYKVKGIELKSDVVRYYDITEIHREFDETIDTQPNNGNTITEVAHDVSKQWTVCTLEGKVYYNCVETETILITDKYVGFVEYEDGFSWKSLIYDSACQSHFVAFSTDHDIERLIEADVSFVSQTRSYYVDNLDIYSSMGTPTTHSITLNHTQKAEYETSHWFTTYKYSWDRIQTSSEFLSSTADIDIYSKTPVDTYGKTKLTEYGKSNISNKQWVLRFCETDYREMGIDATVPMTGILMKDYYTRIDETAISDVTILRLKFETDGVVYNLGVVDNKANGSGISDSYTDWTVELSETFKSVMEVVGYILLIIIAVAILSLLAVFTPVFKLTGKGIVAILKVVWWIICSPIYLFKGKK